MLECSMVVARHTVPMLAGSLVQDIDGEHGIVLIMEGKGGKCLSHVHHGCVDPADVNATVSANASGDQADALKDRQMHARTQARMHVHDVTHKDYHMRVCISLLCTPVHRGDTGRSTSLGREPEERLVSEGREVPGATGLLRGGSRYV